MRFWLFVVRLNHLDFPRSILVNVDSNSRTPEVIITRPIHQAQNLAEKLQDAGRQVSIFPLFEIEPLTVNPELDSAMRELSRFAMVIFVSPNAVDAWFRRVSEATWRWPSAVAIGVVGAASRQALYKHGVDQTEVRIVSPVDTERTDSETLLAALDIEALRGKKVLLVRAESGREFLADALSEQHIDVLPVVAYRRLIPDFDQEKKTKLQQYLSHECDWVITSSAVLQTLLNWCSQLDQQNAVVKMQQQHIVVPHFRIAEVARKLGFKHISLTASGDEKLLRALQSKL